MKLIYLVFCLTLLAQLTAAELLDRIAVSIGAAVITESELLEQMRIRALLDDSPLRFDSDSKRDAADRLIQQALIRREIETTRFTSPDTAQAESLLAAFKLSRFQNDDTLYLETLRHAGVTPSDLQASFLWQLTVLRFIEFRFRPGIQIAPEDIRAYYDRKFVPAWQERSKDPPPSLETATPTIDEILVQDRIDNQLDRWISLNRSQTSIRYREEVFADEASP